MSSVGSSEPLEPLLKIHVSKSAWKAIPFAWLTTVTLKARRELPKDASTSAL